MTEEITLSQPGDFGLKHEEWRPNQFETIEWALKQKTAMVVEAPTGFGKTALAKAVGSQRKTTVALTRTKNLQETNYANDYEFAPLYGRMNYPCPKEPGNTAADCTHMSNMKLCKFYDECSYAQKREIAKKAQFATLNYALWLSSRSSWPTPELLICDEAHELPDLVLEWAGVTVTKERQEEYHLLSFPRITSSGNASKSAFLAKKQSSEETAINWLDGSIKILKKQVDYLEKAAADNPKQKSKHRAADLFLKKLEATLEAMKIAPNDWYIRSGPGSLANGGWGFIAKPLTAKHHFPHYFMGENDLILMSGTIGDPAVFAKELGIKDFSSKLIPSLYTPQQMPVYVLDVPRIGHKSTDKHYDIQAMEIAKAIRRCPQNWSGIIHVNSIAQSKALSGRLAKIDSSLGNRLWSPRPGTSTNSTVQEWEWRRNANKKVGGIIVTWNLHEGYNGTEEKINICAKIPYPFLGDPFEKERQMYNGSYYLQRAANGAEQMMGRTRRGRPEDYDTSQEMRGMNCIADGNWNWVKKYFSSHFRNCITTL